MKFAQSTVLLITDLYKEQVSIHYATIQRCLRRPALECNALYTLTVGTKILEKGAALSSGKMKYISLIVEAVRSPVTFVFI